MQSTSPIFESWDTLFSECFAIGGKYVPHSRWGRCTRYLSYEPGIDSLGGAKERQQGRFTFESAALRKVIMDDYGDSLEGCPEYQAMVRWLSRADWQDDRITRLPNELAIMTKWVERLLERDECRVFCRACGKTIYWKLIREMGNQLRPKRILCPNIHLLMNESPLRRHRDGPPTSVAKELRMRRRLEKFGLKWSSRYDFSDEVFPPAIPLSDADAGKCTLDALSEGRPCESCPNPKETGKLRNRFESGTLHVCWVPHRVERAERPIVCP